MGVVIIVDIVVKPEFVDKFIEATKKSQTSSLNENGCMVYQISRDPSESNKFTLVEEYVDEEAIEYHKSTPHFQEWRNVVYDWMLVPRVSKKMIEI